MRPKHDIVKSAQSTDDPMKIRRRLLADGFEPVPTRGKQPLMDKWSKGDITPERLTSWEEEHPDHTNTGLRTGRTVAIDVDVRSNDLLGSINFLLPDVLGESDFIRVGMKGYAALYSNSAPIEKITVEGRYAGYDKDRSRKERVEILGVGQQLVAHGTHPDTGKPYRWPKRNILNASLSDLPTVTPAKLKDAARAIHQAFVDSGIFEVVLPLSFDKPKESAKSGEPVTYTMLREMLTVISPDIPREQWIALLGGIRSAVVLEDETGEGISDDEIEALAMEWSRGDLCGIPYSHPDFDEDRIRRDYQGLENDRKGGSGLGTVIKAAREAGYVGPSEIPPMERFDDTDYFASDDNPNRSGPVAFSALLADPPKKVAELVPNWIEKGIAQSISGPGGTNKSRFALQMGHAIHNGRDFLGMKTEQAHFVFLSAEDDRDEIQRRAHAMRTHMGIPDSTDALYWDCHGKNAALVIMKEGIEEPEFLPFYAELRDKLKRIPGHKFVVLDSLYNFARFAGKAKIDEDLVNLTWRRVLDVLCAETDSTLLVIMHPSQAGQERGDASGWSVAWNNAPRARSSLKKAEKGQDRYVWRMEKRNHGPHGHELELLWSSGVLVEAAKVQVLDEDTLDKAVFKLASECAEKGQPITEQRALKPWHFTALTDACGFKPKEEDVKDRLSKAVHSGQFRYVTGDKYRAAGYYPADTAEELAKQAKKIQKADTPA